MITDFIRSLKKSPDTALFNPWYQRDEEHDDDPGAPEIRRHQLKTYLSERIGRAKYLFVAEALGYQGGHFTGIAMTSERILLGHQESRYGIRPRHVFRSSLPQRTSCPVFIKKGMSEPTATIMWGALISQKIDPYEVVLWNAVPWHPFDPDRGMLSNRTPTSSELKAGLVHLKAFVNLFGEVKMVAVGKKCEMSLSKLDIDYIPVRHPANGGAAKFRKQIKNFINI